MLRHIGRFDAKNAGGRREVLQGIDPSPCSALVRNFKATPTRCGQDRRRPRGGVGHGKVLDRRKSRPRSIRAQREQNLPQIPCTVGSEDKNVVGTRCYEGRITARCEISWNNGQDGARGSEGNRTRAGEGRSRSELVKVEVPRG